MHLRISPFRVARFLKLVPCALLTRLSYPHPSCRLLADASCSSSSTSSSSTSSPLPPSQQRRDDDDESLKKSPKKEEEELTLAILKPDLVANPADLAAVKSLILDADFRVLRERRLRLSADDAHRFYAEHQGKFFFNRLVTYMTSGDVEARVLAKPDAIAAWRALMGPTKVLRAIYEKPESLRGRFGLTDTRNATHGSDSIENALKEILFFFPDFFDGNNAAEGKNEDGASVSEKEEAEEEEEQLGDEPHQLRAKK